jgi:acetylornithine deacetylase/succinyl-diaminopimelate desuccinylase-like protein
LIPESKIDWTGIEAEAAGLLSRYIQFDTTNPPGNEGLAVEFLADTLSERGFTPTVIKSGPGRANLIARLEGRPDAVEPPCLLYAHSDVVPAEAAYWSVPPFAGHSQNGFVWGRGALDSKGLGIIFLQALALLKDQGQPLNRDVILLIAADEEASGRYGVAWLLDHHPELIEAEYVWDEGGMGRRQANQTLYHIAIAEKTPLTVRLVALGTAGHASIPRQNNPQDRLVRALFRIRQWQQPPRLTEPVVEMLKTLAAQRSFPQSFLYAHADRPIVASVLRQQLERDPLFAALVCNTINLTILKGGVASNVVPGRAEATLDVRLLPGEDPDVFLSALRSIIGDSSISIEVGDLPPTQITTPSNTEFFQALVDALKALGPAGAIMPYLTPGATDSRFFRAVGMKAYGFMPMLLDDKELSRIHGVDERLSLANLRWGIQVVFETLRKL